MRHLFFTCGMVLLALAGPPAGAAAAEAHEAERLLFLLQYVGTDYGNAVADGRIVNAFEYQEVSAFGDLLVERFDVLRQHGAPAEVAAGLARLRELIHALAPWDEVRALAGDLATTLFERLQTVTLPVATPDPARGTALYAQSCAPCHGPRGGGDGFADPEMDPPATSFRDSRMQLLSPHQVFAASFFGVEGTAMPAFRDALPTQDLWDVAFHTLTLRADFAPQDPPPGARVALEDVVRLSSDALRRRFEADGLPADAAAVDHYRLRPPEFRLPRELSPAVAPAAPPARAGALAEPGAGLGLALQLQDAFAAVADAVLPSVVTVTVFEREKPGAGKPAAKDETWRSVGPDVEPYPGFRRVRSGSGFFVTEDGFLLTGHHVVTGDDGSPAEVIDVELPGGRRVLSRLVGAEPTIDLAVLRLEVVSNSRPPVVRPVTVGDSDLVKVGHWTIAVGDPWGPARSFAVGTLAAQPERECYQDQLSATFMQASLSVHPEAYGGPLVDIHGRVVGMTVPPPRGAGVGPRGSELALPINLAMNLYAALKVAESRRSPWLGLSVLELAAVHRRSSDTPDALPALPRTGVFIDGVFESSPASRAGIRAGDSLVAIDGNRLFSVLDFQKWLYLAGIGRTVELELFREGKTETARVTIEERPPGATTR